jgi:hypothetical protein
MTPEELALYPERPPLYYASILAYINSNSLDEFLELDDDDRIHIPEAEGELVVMKRHLIYMAQQEVKSHIDENVKQEDGAED